MCISSPNPTSVWQFGTFSARGPQQPAARRLSCVGTRQIRSSGPGYSLLDVKMGRTVIRPNVDCRFQVVWSDSSANAHQIIKCFRTRHRYVLPTFVRGNDDGNGVGQFSNWDILRFPSGALAPPAQTLRIDDAPGQ